MRHVFTIVPAGNGPLVLFGALSALMLVLVAVFMWLAFSSQYARFEVSPEGLRLVGDFWGRRIPAGTLVVTEARVVNLVHEHELQPRRRTMGTGSPGYLAGWFRLRNGSKALLYVTDRTRVAYVPTTEGYVILLSVEEPERFLTVLRETTRG